MTKLARDQVRIGAEQVRIQVRIRTSSVCFRPETRFILTTTTTSSSQRVLSRSTLRFAFPSLKVSLSYFLSLFAYIPSVLLVLPQPLFMSLGSSRDTTTNALGSSRAWTRSQAGNAASSLSPPIRSPPPPVPRAFAFQPSLPSLPQMPPLPAGLPTRPYFDCPDPKVASRSFLSFFYGLFSFFSSLFRSRSSYLASIRVRVYITLQLLTVKTKQNLDNLAMSLLYLFLTGCDMALRRLFLMG